ncbi:hypothetical protein BKA66DRAFT_435230, partial [Pyrenochaeta sp. MPI-SDFR-AT-0127]
LRTELEYKYELDYINSISYTLTINIYCLNASSPNLEYKSALYLLTNRNAVTSEYKRSRDFTFYLLGYLNIKRLIRYRLDNLLVDKGFTTATLTLPISNVNTTKIKAK